MNIKLLKQTKWTGGRLMAFSGVDGATDFERGLIARTSFQSPGIDVMLPGAVLFAVWNGVSGGKPSDR